VCDGWGGQGAVRRGHDGDGRSCGAWSGGGWGAIDWGGGLNANSGGG
jgi:hypothetical protein